MKFKGYLIRESEGNFNGSIEDIDIPKLEQGRVLIKVRYSSLNYKDALAASGAKGVASSYPFVPGIELVPFNNVGAISDLYDKKAERIACFMVEPIQGLSLIHI